MLFSIQEICKLLGVTPFEAFVTVDCWLVFSVLLSLKVENYLLVSWAKVFVPLFVSNGANWYFATIVLIRRLRQEGVRPRLVIPKYIASLFSICMMLTVEILLVRRLDGQITNMLYSEICVPLYCWFMLLVLFYCAGCSRPHGTFRAMSVNT